MVQIERFTCQKCGKRWWALDVPHRLPCTCDPEFMPKYLATLEANGERTEVFYYGPPVDRLQQWPTLIDSAGKLYKVNAQIFASEAVYARLHAEIAALKAAARDVLIAPIPGTPSDWTSEWHAARAKLRDLVHPPAVSPPKR